MTTVEKTLEEQRQEIASHIARLQDELSNLNVTDANGRRLSTAEWHERRRLIKRVYNSRVEALRLVNIQIKERNVGIYTEKKSLKEQLAQALEERDRARRVLRDFEWDDNNLCPICCNSFAARHADNCPMPRALGETE